MIGKITCVVNDTALENSGLRSEHGLSFWIETEAGIALLDTGMTGKVLFHNMQVLGLDPRKIQALALSHAHYDHTGGLETLLAVNHDLTIYAHPDIFRPRYSLKKGNYESVGLTLPREDLSELVRLNLNPEPARIFPGLWTTGEISERPELQGSSSTHFIRENESWQLDRYTDDLSLVLEVGDGLALICGCCHAGLLNTLAHVKRRFDKPIRFVFGGTHLLSADGPSLTHVIEVLASQFPDLRYFLNHCTGEKAIQKLSERFTGQVNACPAGTIVDLDLMCANQAD